MTAKIESRPPPHRYLPLNVATRFSFLTRFQDLVVLATMMISSIRAVSRQAAASSKRTMVTFARQEGSSNHHTYRMAAATAAGLAAMTLVAQQHTADQKVR